MVKSTAQSSGSQSMILVRQEIDEPPHNQSEFVLCGQILQEENSRKIEIGGWALPR